MSFDAISAICTVCARCEAESAALSTADCFDTNKRTEKHNKRYCADVDPREIIEVVIKDIYAADTPRDYKGDQRECREIFHDFSHMQCLLRKNHKKLNVVQETREHREAQE